jgi:hypothetical protein
MTEAHIAMQPGATRRMTRRAGGATLPPAALIRRIP